MTPQQKNGGTRVQPDTAEHNLTLSKKEIDMPMVANASSDPRYSSPHTERFLEFHSRNPEVYWTVLASSLEYKRMTGNEKCGMSLLFGRARWEIGVKTIGDDFRINNNYAGYYARLIEWLNPHLEGTFSMRHAAFTEKSRAWLPVAARTVGMGAVRS